MEGSRKQDTGLTRKELLESAAVAAPALLIG